MQEGNDDAVSVPGKNTVSALCRVRCPELAASRCNSGTADESRDRGPMTYADGLDGVLAVRVAYYRARAAKCDVGALI